MADASSLNGDEIPGPRGGNVDSNGALAPAAALPGKSSSVGEERDRTPLVCHGHSRPIVSLSYSPVTEDGSFIVSASKDGKPMLRNGDSGDWVGTFEGHKGAVWDATLNRPATRALTGSADFTACVWDALTGDAIHSFQHKHIVRTVEFNPEGNKALTGGYEKYLRVFDPEKPDAEPQTLNGGEDNGAWSAPIRNATWVENLVFIALSDKNGVSVIDTRANSVAYKLDTDAPVTSIEPSWDASRITTADGCTVRIFDAAKGSSGAALSSFKLSYPVESASLHPAGKLMACGGDDMWGHVLDISAAEPVELECHRGHHGPVHVVRFAPDGLSYATGSEDGTIRIWSTPDRPVVE